MSELKKRRMLPNLTRVALSLAVVSALAACQTNPAVGSQAADQGPQTVRAADALQQAAQLRQSLVPGLYEVTYDEARGALFVAATPDFDPKSAGFLYRLDPGTLQILQTIEAPRRTFALGLNSKTGALYVGNTMEGSLTVVDSRNGAVLGVIQLAQADAEGNYDHTRKVIIDEQHNRVFVTSPNQRGTVWIIDGATGQLTHTLDNVGKWAAGAAYDAERNRLYVSHGGDTGEVVAVIDPDKGEIVERFTLSDGKEHFLVNSALDAQGQRLFSTDGNADSLLVFNTVNGELLRSVPVGVGVLDVIYNPTRNEIYVTNRGVSREKPEGTGKVTVIDGASYAVKRVIDLPVHPNSLALSPDQQTLFVTVKAPHGDKHPAARKGSVDSVVRISLQ